MYLCLGGEGFGIAYGSVCLFLSFCSCTYLCNTKESHANTESMFGVDWLGVGN
jgi:hypothetical protein